MKDCEYSASVSPTVFLLLLPRRLDIVDRSRGLFVQAQDFEVLSGFLVQAFEAGPTESQW